MESLNECYRPPKALDDFNGHVDVVKSCLLWMAFSTAILNLLVLISAYGFNFSLLWSASTLWAAPLCLGILLRLYFIRLSLALCLVLAIQSGEYFIRTFGSISFSFKSLVEALQYEQFALATVVYRTLPFLWWSTAFFWIMALAANVHLAKNMREEDKGKRKIRTER